MPSPGEGYLPPIVASIIGDASDFIAKLEEVKTMGDDFDATVYAAQLELESARAISGMEETRLELDAIASKPIVMNVEVNIDKASLLASMAAIGVATKAAGASGGGSGGGGLLAGGLLSRLLWGGGAGGIAGAVGLGGLGGMGSIGSLAGFGPEHVLMTLLGIGGSAAGGAIGGGLLAAGALTTAGVGMGTDLAGMGQAAGDIKNVVTAQNALNQAIAVYGPASYQAADAQKQLNYQLNSFSPLAQQAVLAAANTAQGFHQAFNAATGAAESTGAQIINMGMQVAEKFLPELGKAAATNMSIIQSSLEGPKGLFEWFGTQGLSIFTQIENHFTAQLPTAMDALTNGAELLIKTLGYLSSQTGGFIGKLDTFLQNANGPGFDKWIADIDKLIADFHLWASIVYNLGRDIVDLFSNDAGTANSILTYLDQMLIKLGDWERSTEGKTDLHNIFEVHKQEIMELLKLLPGLLSGFGEFYLTVAPAFTTVATDLLKVLVPILTTMEKMPFGTWVVGLGLISGKLFGIKSLLGGIGGLANAGLGALGIETTLGTGSMTFSGAVGVFSAAVNRFAAGSVAGGATGAAEGGFFAEGAAGLFGGASLSEVGIGLAAAFATAVGGFFAGKGIGGLVGGQTGSAIGGGVGAIGGGAVGGAMIGTAFGGIGAVPGAILGAIGGALLAFWPAITTAIKKGFEDIAGFFHNLPGDVADFAKHISGAIGDAFGDVASFFESLPGDIASFASKIPGAIGTLFTNIANFFKDINWYQLGQTIGTAIRTLFGNIANFFWTLISRIPGFIGTVLGDMGSFFSQVGNLFSTLIGRLPGFLGTVGSDMGSFFGNVGNFFLTLISRIPGMLATVGTDVLNFFTGKNGVSGLFSTLIGRIPGFLGTLISDVAQFFAGIVVGFVGKDVVKKIGDLASSILGAIGTLAANIAKAIASIPVSIFKSLLGAKNTNPSNPHDTSGNAALMGAAGMTLPLGAWGIVGEMGAEAIYASASGTRVFPNASGATRSLMGGGGNVQVSINAPVSVVVPAGTSQTMAAQVARATQQAVAKTLGQVAKGMNGGAYATMPA